ncbi:MAG: HNH endonuclease [Planctomycetes bacterium]|nr:HNH endonuclease [Planctomycetota bacterium]
MTSPRSEPAHERTVCPQRLRERVAARAQRRCGYCLTQEAVVGTPMEIEHIIPESLGGLTEEENLWVACPLCNQHKGNRIAALDPVTGEVVRLFDPRRQGWKDHFAWSPGAERVIGLTPSGRATVLALNLNRPSLVSARSAWAAVGWHPPHD